MRYLAIGHICQDICRMAGCSVGRSRMLQPARPRAGLSRYRSSPALNPISTCARCCVDIDVVRCHPIAPRPSRMCIPIRAGSKRCTPWRNTSHPIGFRRLLQTDIVHLAPIAQEVDLGWLDCFPGALIGVTPQGWLRQWDAAGRVSPIGWAEAAKVLSRADVVIISIEDIGHNEDHRAGVGRAGQSAGGDARCTRLHCSSKQHRHRCADAFASRLVDATGAGDIFAASYLVRLRQTSDPIAAARFANCLASHSITRRGLAVIPTPSEIEEC